MKATGKYIDAAWMGKPLILCNQRCREWTHPYEYQGNGSMLCNAGCGIFSVIHAAHFFGKDPCTPEELADFSCKYGGRGDDGTDRPALLAAMEAHGLAKDCGFSYHGDGLRNDLPVLAHHLEGGNAALCNLRVGHIVTLIGYRVHDGEEQVLAADPYSESIDSRVLPAVREVIPGSEVVSPIRNADNLICGWQTSYALYWCALATVRDFNLLHKISA